MKLLMIAALAIATISEAKQVCTPGSQFKDYCNSCTCSKSGSSYFCTLMACDEKLWNKDGTLKINLETQETTEQEPKQVCQPRSSLKKYCNTCACAEDGLSYACTKMICDEKIWNEDGSLKVAPEPIETVESAPKQVCEPGSVFKDYCNTCSCLKDGTFAACTLMFCDEKLWNKDGTLKTSIDIVQEDPETKILEKRESKKVCEPLSHFKDYCNSCVCSKDGLSMACTDMACDERIFNKDGSIKDGVTFANK